MYRCENCRVKKDFGDDVYLVESVLRNTFSPNCSEECAKETKNKEIKTLQDKIDKLRASEIIKERW